MIMIRTKKYRCWDKELKKWVKPDLIFVPQERSDNYKEMYLEPIGKGVCGMDNSHLVLLECTFCKDKNGKEIYEGDIVRYIKVPTFKKVVKWVGAGFNLNYLKRHHPFLEVIGNKFENPELLEEHE